MGYVYGILYGRLSWRTYKLNRPVHPRVQDLVSVCDWTDPKRQEKYSDFADNYVKKLRLKYCLGFGMRDKEGCLRVIITLDRHNTVFFKRRSRISQSFADRIGKSIYKFTYRCTEAVYCASSYRAKVSAYDAGESYCRAAMLRELLRLLFQTCAV